MDQLLFVYNAKSGLLNSALDMGHKILNPQSYSCSLCALTHGAFAEKKPWTEFRNRSKLDMIFYHSDEFEKAYPDLNFSYPTVLIRSDNQLTEFVSTDELNNMNSLEELIGKFNHFQ